MIIDIHSSHLIHNGVLQEVLWKLNDDHDSHNSPPFNI